MTINETSGQTPQSPEEAAKEQLADYLRRVVEAAGVQWGRRATAHNRARQGLQLLRKQLQIDDSRGFDVIQNQFLADQIRELAAPVTTAIAQRNAAVTQVEWQRADGAVKKEWTTLTRNLGELVEATIPADPPKNRSSL
jgi:hypothetical protein